MNKSKILRTLFNASIFYSIVRLIIFIIFWNANLYDFLYFHFSNDLAWIFLTLILPLSTAVLVAQKVNSRFLTDLGKFFFTLLIMLTITGYGFNKSYWGYIIKRPSIFNEVKNANEVLSITRLVKKPYERQFRILTDSISYKKNDLFLDLYYSNFERPYLVFENMPTKGNLWRFEEIANEKKLKLSLSEVKKIQTLIINSSFLESPEEGYDERGNKYDIQIVEFVTSDESNITTAPTNKSIDQRKPSLKFKDKFLLVSMNSGEISNDHYSFYEFLIKDDQIIKKQKYFYDIAGIEGIEYSKLAPIAEIAVLILSLIIFGIYRLVIKLRKNQLQ